MKPTQLIIVGAVWLAAALAGMGMLARYSQTPGTTGVIPTLWPEDAPLLRERGASVLLVFAHPRCGCTRATIGELARVMTHCSGRLKARVLLFRPQGSAASWADSDLARQAAAIPGVSVVPDEGGEIARRFGAETSGQALLYDRRGELLFRGGITTARGHEGDNDGRFSIEALVLNSGPSAPDTPVYGCSLLDPAPGTPGWTRTCKP